MPGIEEITWLEIKQRLQGAQFDATYYAKEQNGFLLFTYDGQVENVLTLNTAEQLFLLAAYLPKVSRSRRDLRLITEEVQKGELFGRTAKAMMRFRKFSQPPTYQIVAQKIGTHDYKQSEVATAVLKGMQTRLPRWTVVTQAAQVEVAVNLLGSTLLTGLRLTPAAPAKKQATIGIHASTAAAMVLLTEPDANDIFLDPVCGLGQILAARRQAGSYQQIWGGDDRGVEKAARNVLPRRSGRARAISIRQWDPGNLPLAAGQVNKAATHLPTDKKRFNTAVLGELERVVGRNGRIVIFTHAYDQLKTLLRQYPHLEILTGYSVMDAGHWGRVYIIRRKA